MLRYGSLFQTLYFLPRRSWQTLTGEARTRILLWYVLLLGLCVAMAVPLMRYFVISQVNARVREELIEDMAAFEGLLNGEYKVLERFGLGQAELESQDLMLPPNNQEDLKQVFQLYVTRRIPEDDTIFLTFLGSEFYLASVEARPQLLQPGSTLFQGFIRQNHPYQGEQETGDPDVGSVLFHVRPIKANDQRLGTFVALHLNAGERQEAFDVLNGVFKIMVFVLLMTLVIAWMMAGRVLSPLRLLAETARTITATDLTRRIPVQGKGELADLTGTFNDMMDRLESAFATQRDFVNDAGHELRTPITIIRGQLEVMECVSQEQQQTFDLVINELDRMNRFVQDLLLLAKAKRPDFLRFDLIDLQSFTQELFTKISMLAERNWQLETIANGKLVGDRQRITEAVINLAQNAAQHTQPQDAIVLGSSIQNRSVQFWVMDTGEGIALEEQEHIFKRFARASKSRRKSDGAGLGLAIVREITVAHGGEVRLNSQPGMGSTFILIFPLDPPMEMARYD
ncbi:integral membrane sensor signal transduction histidine kinase [Leptolyngbya sp. Heron Island J]|uniref:sensor histidine kinase n=1 Tax=Leptolyngbya sp. Heron Island J TaxID=1385935 RepID=UPI0003B95495|nr:ATP-binding protein [Leptolyngbya sp. Heron Island J]ESA38218.1 integral membrane sensor signal transduction histidine kinase [Leptolyngbya sp. Heron Island J]